MLAWSPGALLNAVSGGLMIALGAAVLVANPRKDWNRVFAILALLWGAEIVAANAVRLVAQPDAARFAGELALAFIVPLYFFTVAFAAIFPRPRSPFGTSGLAFALLLTPAVAALVLLFAAPATLLDGVHALPNGSFTLVWGGLFPYVVYAPFQAAFFYALFVMVKRVDEAERVIERKQVTFVLAALALYVAYSTPFVLLGFGGAVLGVTHAPEAAIREAVPIALVNLVGMGVLAYAARRLAHRARHATGTGARTEARRVLAASGVAVAVAVAIGLARWSGVAAPDLRGLFRAGSVALIVFAIARYQLFDLDLRVKRAGTATVALAGGVALAGVAWVVLGRLDAPAPATGVLSAAAAVLAFFPLLRVSAHLADRVLPGVRPDGDHLFLRKLEVYRAAVETTLRDGGTGDAQDPALTEVRQRLGLAERDHRLVVSLAVARAEAPARAAPDLRPGGVAFGKYVIDKPLAEGGFGRVFLARDRLLGRPVVIKELQARWRGNPTIVKRFLAEARIAGELDHPAIVRVHEVEQHGEDYFVVMEHLAGGTLGERLGRDARLPVADAVAVARAVLDALMAAHARGIVHRDVKPANVLFGARGDVKLTDFGIAQLAEEDAEDTISGLTAPAFHPGTLQYMSPEQARGDPVDARTDVYAVGALLYRCVTGRPHVDVAGLDALTARARVADPPAVPPTRDVPDAVSAAMARALAPDPADRWPTARAFADALEPRVERVTS